MADNVAEIAGLATVLEEAVRRGHCSGTYCASVDALVVTVEDLETFRNDLASEISLAVRAYLENSREQ